MPAHFGGGPTDYQLAEDEGEDGRSRIRLLVHPGLGPLDANLVSHIFLDAIRRGPGAASVMTEVWSNVGVVAVERRPPMTTATGKILHLHTVPPHARATPN